MAVAHWGVPAALTLSVLVPTVLYPSVTAMSAPPSAVASIWPGYCLSTPLMSFVMVDQSTLPELSTLKTQRWYPEALV